jgi:hypothetical protein
MFEFEQFAFAKLQLGQPGRANANQAVLEQANGQYELELHNGRIVWCWQHARIAGEDVVGSNDYWCFRLPLSTAGTDWGWMNLYRPLSGPPLLLDMNYFSGFLRRELAEAIERVMSSQEEPNTGKIQRMAMTPGKIAG